MNLKSVLLVLGLVIGAIAGWTTAPKAVDIQVGPLSVQIEDGGGEGGNITATGKDGQIQVQVGNPSPLNDRNTRTAIFAIVGGIIGFGAGLFIERRKG
jgi:hypothetical protein